MSIWDSVLNLVFRQQDRADARRARTYENRRQAYQDAAALLSETHHLVYNVPIDAQEAREVEQRYPSTPPRGITDALDLDAPMGTSVFAEAYWALSSALGQWAEVAAIRREATERDLWTILADTESEARNRFEDRMRAASLHHDTFREVMRHDLGS